MDKNYKLNLHRLRHEDAKRATIRFVEDWWGSSAELEIITGNSTNMKNLVIEILNEYKLSYQIGRAFDLHNKGYIITWMD